jgi:hypothetical protein
MNQCRRAQRRPVIGCASSCGGIYIASIATAGGKDTDISGNFTSTSNYDVFGVFNNHC